MYSVFIEGLEFTGHHGLTIEEQDRGNHFRVSFSAWVESELPVTDDVEDTVDYSSLAETIVVTSNAQRCKTVELLASRICQAVFDKYPLVSAINMQLSKLNPPMSPAVPAAGVRVDVVRSDD